MKPKISIYIITIIMMAIFTQGAISMWWDTPNQDNEYLTEYPQVIRTFFISDLPITQCTHNLSGMVYTTYDINAQHLFLEKKFKLAEGTYTINVNCTDGTNSIQQEKTFKISDTILFRDSQERQFNYKLFLLAFGILFLIWLITLENHVSLIASGLMLMTSIWLTTIIKNNIMIWIPLLISMILLLTTMFNLYGVKKWRKRR